MKEVRQCLGLAWYFRYYIAGYASTRKTASIARLLRKGEPFSWGSKQDAARDYIINCRTNEPVLEIFDPQLPLEFHTDASAIGFGAILLQGHGGKRKLATLVSLLKVRGPRCHSCDLETLAVGVFVFVRKVAQTAGKLARIGWPQALPHHRCELELLAGSYAERLKPPLNI